MSFTISRSPRTHGSFAALLAAATLVAAALSPGSAQAAPTSTPFEASITTPLGTTLTLNGDGTRCKAVFKVYDLALYTPRKVNTPDALLALPGAKRLQFVALRELSTRDLGRLFVQGIGDNSPREQAQKQILTMSRLIEIFSSRSKIVVGEPFAMEYVPGKGTADDGRCGAVNAQVDAGTRVLAPTGPIAESVLRGFAFA